MSARFVASMSLLAMLCAPPARAQHDGHGDPHAGHVVSTPDPHAGHAQPGSDPHAGQALPIPAPDPHAGHVMPTPTGVPALPALTDADRAAAFPPVAGHPAHDRAVHAYSLLDHLEATRIDGRSAMAWEAEGWIGGDVQRLRWRSEGAGRGGDTDAEVELFYSRGVSAWWDVVAGVRHAWTQDATRTQLAFGVQGTAPYKIPVEATLYVGDGRASARVEAGYETLLTNRWIVQWEATADLHAGADARRGEGSGQATLAAGARLRYEITRKFAPYVGIERERAFGDTAQLRREFGDSVDATRIVAGVRLWF
jgi:copper resistance protein B